MTRRALKMYEVSRSEHLEKCQCGRKFADQWRAAEMSERHVAMFSSQLPPNTHLALQREERDDHVEMDFRLSFVVVGGFTFVIEKFVSLRRGEMSAIQLFAPAADAGAPLLVLC